MVARIEVRLLEKFTEIEQITAKSIQLLASSCSAVVSSAVAVVAEFVKGRFSCSLYQSRLLSRIFKMSSASGCTNSVHASHNGMRDVIDKRHLKCKIPQEIHMYMFILLINNLSHHHARVGTFHITARTALWPDHNSLLQSQHFRQPSASGYHFVRRCANNATVRCYMRS